MQKEDIEFFIVIVVIIVIMLLFSSVINQQNQINEIKILLENVTIGKI